MGMKTKILLLLLFSCNAHADVTEFLANIMMATKACMYDIEHTNTIGTFACFSSPAIAKNQQVNAQIRIMLERSNLMTEDERMLMREFLISNEKLQNMLKFD
jgi:hypothetical protein